jgi:hypothetical protein
MKYLLICKSLLKPFSQIRFSVLGKFSSDTTHTWMLEKILKSMGSIERDLG